MSEYCRPMERSFVCRTNKLIQEYTGKYDGTFLLNCLLGLLVVPFEKNRELYKIESRTSVIRDLFTRLQAEEKYDDYGNDYSDFDIIRNMRNAIAHFTVESVTEHGKITGFRFVAHKMNKYCEDKSEDCPYKNVPEAVPTAVFSAELSIDELKELAGYIKTFVLDLKEDKRCQKCEYRTRA